MFLTIAAKIQISTTILKISGGASISSRIDQIVTGKSLSILTSKRLALIVSTTASQIVKVSTSNMVYEPINLLF